MRVILGEADYTNMDTSAEAKVALNLGMRAVAWDLGFLVEDSFTIASDSFRYALPHTFRPSHKEMDEVEREFHVWFGSIDKAYYYGVAHGSPTEMDEAEGVEPLWNLEDSILHFTPHDLENDKIFIQGLGRVTPISGPETSLSPVPEDLRPAACWYACAVLLVSTDGARYPMCMAEYERYRPKGALGVQP